MNFLNLSLGELMGLVGTISAAVVALYLLDRSKHRQLVATLRFWAPAEVRTELKHRRRIQQPWSLVLQLLSLALLLLAMAGPRWSGEDRSSRDHVLVLDTSAWMGARSRQGTLMDDARAAARAYLKSLPSRDRVMLVRADALATPATAFESNRQVLEEAIRRSQPGASALNLEQALEFAQRAQRGNGGRRRLGLRRSPASPDTWEIFVAARNYGVRRHDVDLALQFGGAPAGSRRVSLKPRPGEQIPLDRES